MEKRRLRNDITLNWEVLTNRERVSLAGREIKVTCTDRLGNDIPVEWEISDADACVLIVTLRGVNITKTGVLTLICTENDGEDNMRELDVRATEIVAHSWEEEGMGSDPILATGSIGRDMPAALIIELEGIAEAEAARVLAEEGRVEAEEDRVNAEESRVGAEEDRVDAEAARVLAENAREETAAADHTQAGEDHTASVAATAAANEAVDKAEDVSEHPNIIGNNGNWWSYDVDNGVYVDTGVVATNILGFRYEPSDGTIRMTTVESVDYPDLSISENGDLVLTITT